MDEFLVEVVEVNEQDQNSCEGCKHYNDGDGDNTCNNCCRNYEEDYYERE